MTDRHAWVVGTWDTKGTELSFIHSVLEEQGVSSIRVDLSTSNDRPSNVDITASEIAACHPKGPASVFTGDRGSSVSAMVDAFKIYAAQHAQKISGMISAGGSGGTALATPAMQMLEVGVPKVMISTMASGDVRGYVGPADICMMYSVSDVQGINQISKKVLANGAGALAGMIRVASHLQQSTQNLKPAIGLSMFGVTTACVQAVVGELEADYDCLVFHATGAGGQSMEKLASSRMLKAVLDLTTTEICDYFMDGILSAGETRLEPIIESGLPYIGSCGALDMVNFGALETVPNVYKNRNLYVHNPQITLMRTTPDENKRMGEWIGEKLNRMTGPVRFLLPESGVSMLDAPGQAFHDPEADNSLFEALENTVTQTPNRKLVRIPAHINDPAFVHSVTEAFREIVH